MSSKQKDSKKDKQSKTGSVAKNNQHAEKDTNDTRQGYQGPIVGGG